MATHNIPEFVDSPPSTPVAPAPAATDEDMLNRMTYNDMILYGYIDQDGLGPIRPLLDMIQQILVNKGEMERGDDVMDWTPDNLVTRMFELFFVSEPDMYAKLLTVLQPFQYEGGFTRIKDAFSQTLIEVMPLLEEIFVTVRARSNPVQVYAINLDGSATSVARSQPQPARVPSPRVPSQLRSQLPDSGELYAVPSSPRTPLRPVPLILLPLSDDEYNAQHEDLDHMASESISRSQEAAQSEAQSDAQSEAQSEAQSAAQTQGAAQPISLIGVNYFVVLHGQEVSSDQFAYKMEHPIGKRISYAVPYGLCPRTETVPGVGGWIGVQQIIEAETFFPSQYVKFISGTAEGLGDRCKYDEAEKSVIIHPHLFALNPSDPSDDLAKYMGIWRFDFWSNQTFTKVHLIDWDTMNTMYNLSKQYATYMFLFNFILKNLKNIKREHHSFNDEENASIMLYCCRKLSHSIQMPMLELKPLESGGYYTLPTGANIVESLSNAVPFVKIFPNSSINPAINPMLTRELHVTTQGCLYNLLTYYGIFNELQGNIMTSMQSEGVTTRQFINLMNKHDQINMLPPHNYAVTRLPPNNAFMYLLTQVFKSIEDVSRQHQKDYQARDQNTYALFIKLYPLNYIPRTTEHSEIGHWVSISYSQMDGWRYIDPQALSYFSREQQQFMPVTHFSLTETTLPEAFRRINTGVEMIDIIYVESHDHYLCSNVTCRIGFSNLKMQIQGRTLKGGKTKKLRLKSKSRPKSKSKYNKTRPNKHKANKRKRNKTQRKRK